MYWHDGEYPRLPQLCVGLLLEVTSPPIDTIVFQILKILVGGFFSTSRLGGVLIEKTGIIKFVIFAEDVLYLLQTNKEMIVQRLKKELINDTEVSHRYYSVLSALNDLELTEREVQLMSFIAVSGSISIPSNREKFCSTYQTTGATVNNMVSKLKKRNLLLKKDGKIVVNPLISLDFSNDISLEIKILHGGKA